MYALIVPIYLCIFPLLEFLLQIVPKFTEFHFMALSERNFNELSSAKSTQIWIIIYEMRKPKQFGSILWPKRCCNIYKTFIA